jgi:2-polyprenyl-6-methoxyphenol hydroxylase-like FAD-dependent oxidoreductase
MEHLDRLDRLDVAIIGAGPVGLTLACLLAQKDVNVVVLEQRTERSPHSRAIGIHPPALKVLDTLGIGNAIRAEGVAIAAGQVFYNTQKIGRLTLPTPALSLPQSRTEAILEERLHALAPRALRRGVQLMRLESSASSGVQLFCDTHAPLTASLLVGCDGMRSTVRAQAGITWKGDTYPDRYLMGDFADDTDFASDATLFFSREGIVESFPLPERQRRWVARLEKPIATTPDITTLATIVQDRTGHRLPVSTCTWVSPFGIQGYVATRFLQENIALLGDAAHVVSPIGGQGMNLGILGAATLAAHWQGTSNSLATALTEHHRRALTVRKRADFNTKMGRPLAPLDPRRALIAAVLHLPPLARHFAHAFTMSDLGE